MQAQAAANDGGYESYDETRYADSGDSTYTPDSGAIRESAEVAEVEVDVVGDKDEDGNRDGTDDRVDVH
ncbi:hypothetical protein V8E52_011614, partial [Russula decolorans]